jgi:predicted porin
MRIRHLTLAATLAAAPVLAQAQSVTWYGLVDVGVETMNNVGSARERLTRMPSYTGTLPSRLGVRGAEDLGSGASVVYTLENGFAPDSGSMTQGGRLFGRQAWAGLAAPWGTVSFGRIYTMTYWSLLDADVIGPAIFSAASIDSYLPNARVDNALGYKASFGPLTVGATYSFGRDAVNAGPSPAGTNCAGERAGDARDPGRGDRDDLPGTDDLAQPGLHHRRPDRRGRPSSSEERRFGGEGARRGHAAPRGHSQPGAAGG